MKGPARCVTNLAVPASLQISKEDGHYRCPLCPCRTFIKVARVVQQLDRYYTADRKFSAVGPQQLRIIKAGSHHQLESGRRRHSVSSKLFSVMRH